VSDEHQDGCVGSRLVICFSEQHLDIVLSRFSLGPVEASLSLILLASVGLGVLGDSRHLLTSHGQSSRLVDVFSQNVNSKVSVLEVVDSSDNLVQADLDKVGPDAPQDSQLDLATQDELLCLVSLLLKLSASVHFIEGVVVVPLQARGFLNQEASHHILFVPEHLVIIVPVGVAVLEVVLLVILTLLGFNHSLRILRLLVMVGFSKGFRLADLTCSAVRVTLSHFLVTVGDLPEVIVGKDFSFGVLLDLTSFALLTISSFRTTPLFISRGGGISAHGVIIRANVALAAHRYLAALL
jgi:hypothetical protein